MEKFGRFLFVCCFLLASFSVNADDGGKVILELSDEEYIDLPKEKIPALIKLGMDYIDDVKEYNDLLIGDNIEKDFSEDIKSKYPNYDDKKVDVWQKYVKKGVELYRLYEDVKKRVVDFVMNQDLPLVVDDDQYEMGDNEDYIETDSPLIIHDFKKVVAYSDLEKDQLAAEEKRAKDLGLPLPSETIKKYKKALLEKDWKTLLNFSWKDFLPHIYSSVESEENVTNDFIRTSILTKFDGVNDGKISGVVNVAPQQQGMILLSSLREFQGLKVDFTKSENLKDVKVSFVWPQWGTTSSGENILGYVSPFSIYFTGEAIDKNLPVVIRVSIVANLCIEENCKQVENASELKLLVKKDYNSTLYSTHIDIVSNNVPKDSNAKLFDIEDAVWIDGKDHNLGSVRLRVEVDDPANFRVFIIGKDADKFRSPRYAIDGDIVTVYFDVMDKSYSAKDKDYLFWMYMGSTKQYLKMINVEEFRGLHVGGNMVSWKILWLALVGGFLLNFMPCVFPVLSLKLLSLTKFGGKNESNIRRNFMFNSLGIVVSFIVIAILLSLLKLAGYTIGWGMQFQNIYFLVTIIWLVMFFLAYVFGFITLKTPEFASDILNKTKNKVLYFEFFSGVFLVLLSTPCMAPYLGTVIGIALTGTIMDIWMIISIVGLGLAIPYILVSICPSIVICMPKPGKWMDVIHIGMLLMLVITLGWLFSILAVQTSFYELWHWLLYAVATFILLFFRKALKLEIDKLENREFVRILHRRSNIFFGVIFIILFTVSLYNAISSSRDKIKLTQETKSSIINMDNIQKQIKNGNKVIVKIGANWCLTCKYNDAFVWNSENISNAVKNNNVIVYEVDWTHYDKKVLEFMHKYGRSGLPFYIFFSAKFLEGFVLSEMPNQEDIYTLIDM